MEEWREREERGRGRREGGGNGWYITAKAYRTTGQRALDSSTCHTCTPPPPPTHTHTLLAPLMDNPGVLSSLFTPDMSPSSTIARSS